MPYSNAELIRKYEAALATHTAWIQQYYEAFLYITPQRDCLNQLLKYLDKGLINTYQIYSTTAPNAAIERANKLVRMLMPDNQRWGKLAWHPENIKAHGLTDDDMVKAEDALYFYKSESNLSQQTQDAFVDEAIGCGALWVENPTDEEPLVFQSVPGFSVIPEFYSGNRVRDLWYPFSASGQYILDNYEKLPVNILATLKAAPNDTYWIIRGVIYDPEDTKTKKNPWRVVDMMDNSVTGKKSDTYTFIYDENFAYKKLIYFRDRVRPGEAVGRGPGIEYLPTIRRLNFLCQLSDQADEIRAYPPQEVDETKINLDMMTNLAGSAVPKGTFGNSLQLPPSPEVQAKIDKYELEVQKGFMVAPIGGLNQPVRTAEEISQRIDANMENTTIDVSRLLQESSKPLFETMFSILLDLGLIPNADKFKKALSAEKKALLFKYENPLGDIEKNNNMAALAKGLQFSQQYFGPQYWTSQYKIDKLQDFIVANSTTPANIQNDGKALAKVVQKMVEQANSAPQAPTNSLPQPSTAPAKPQALTPQGITL